MIKQRTIIEVEVKGREFRLECASESNWQDVVDALVQMHNFAQERIKALTPSEESKQSAEEVIIKE